jgi:hypothetical protein
MAFLVQQFIAIIDANDKLTKPHKLNTVLTEIDEQIICEFRKKIQLALDDIFIALKNEIPFLSRSIASLFG